jgi:hypothetical protein
VSGSAALARTATVQNQRGLEQLEAMARLAAESKLVVHVVLPRAPGVVEHGRMVAAAAGVECYADVRARSVRMRFTP